MIKKRILFYVHVSSHLKSFLKLIERLQIEKEYEPVVFLNWGNGWDLSKDVVFCKEQNIPFILDSEGLRQNTDEMNFKTTQAIDPYYSPLREVNSAGFKSRMKWLVNKYFSILLIWHYSKKRLKEFSDVLQANKINAIILPEDLYENPAIMVRAAKKHAIPSILMPWAKCNHEDVVQVCEVEVRGVRRLFCWLFPKWKIKFSGKEIMSLKLSEIIVMKILGMAPSKPFLRWGGEV